MVAAARRGAGIGRALIEDSLRWAREAGFRAMQFNAVAEPNTSAVRLYERVGFVTVRRVPGAFRHPEHGEVALLVMHRPLRRLPCGRSLGGRAGLCGRRS